MPNPLRNPNIDYGDGWFFVTVQVALNKSVFGAIIGEECALNGLGIAVRDAWISHPAHNPGLYIDTFVVMPNHFHAVVRVTGGDGDNRLSRMVGRFKSYTSTLYRRFKEAGRCVDIGAKLWQESYYDNLISSHEELLNIRAYIHNNPRNWNRDRFGPVTAYSVGNPELLSKRLVAFVASEGGGGGGGQCPHLYESVCPRPYENTAALTGGGSTPAPTRIPPPLVISWPRGHSPPVVSTFTSPEERAIFGKCLRKERAFVWVCPGGIPAPLPRQVAAACAAGWGFVCSPVPSGTGVNKQRAIWCNQYVIRHAASVWTGHIRSGGSLETILRELRGKRE